MRGLHCQGALWKYSVLQKENQSHKRPRVTFSKANIKICITTVIVHAGEWPNPIWWGIQEFQETGQVFKSLKEVSYASYSRRGGYKPILKQLFLKILVSLAIMLQEMMRQDFHFWIYKSKHFLYQKIPFQNSLSWFLIHASPFLFPVILAIIF